MIEAQNLENLRLRVYQFGFRPADFKPELMKPATTFVEPVRPPEGTAGGLYTGPLASDVPGVACKLFRVLAVAAVQPEAGIVVTEPGDLVTLRQSMLDPLTEESGNMIMSIKSEHILHKFDKEHEEPVPRNLSPALLVPDTRILGPDGKFVD